MWKGLDQRRATLWHRCVSSKATPKHLLRDAAALHPASTTLPCACAVARAHFLASRATAILSAGVAPGSERDSGSEALLSAETAVIAVLVLISICNPILLQKIVEVAKSISITCEESVPSELSHLALSHKFDFFHLSP